MQGQVDVSTFKSIISYLLLFLLLILSAFFSSSETAFSSVNLIRLKNATDEGKRGAKKALYVADHFDKTLSAILIGNNIVNIATASLVTILSIDVFDKTKGPIVATLVTTVFILIFGEILPKSYAKENSLKFCVRFGWLLLIFIRIFYPFVFIIMKIKNGLSNIFEKNKDNSLPSVTEDELEVIIDTMEEEGVIEEEEKEMIRSVLDLSETKVYDIMTPRVDMVGVYCDDEIDFIKDCFLKEKFSRMPVYMDSKDNIIGILYQRNFFEALITIKDQSQIKVKELMRKPIYVPKSMHVDDLMELLQRNKQHLAIVSDEYGGTSGLVTMEDCLEELVGEIYDEHDEEEFEIKKLDENNYIVNASISLEDLFEELEFGKAPETHYNSVGGWLYEKLEEIPIVGDQYVYTSLIKIEHDVTTIDADEYYELILTFTVKELHNRRMKKIHLEIKRSELDGDKNSENND
ncbi:HlyC/CorC family transporter [Mycoplasmatota bacterium]|nr:HlyC/CorC family transporter [Mycoplasmatota bacterium]